MNDVRGIIQAEMAAAFPAHEERVARFYKMQQYQLGWYDADLQPARTDPGKLLRPQLALTACRAAGGPAERALPLAAAIQLVHDFSLIHDDIEDDSATRRGRTTLWKVWGLAQGINAGDGMLIVAHLALHRLLERGVPAATVLEVARRFDNTILTVCEGQYLDLSYEGQLDISPADYLAMIERKTAVLVSAAASLGALVGGANEDTVTAFSEFGVNLGLAFQIQDDVLGIWGDPELTGKPYAADLLRRKLSYPIIHALADPRVGAELRQRYQTPHQDGEPLGPLFELLDIAGAQHATEQLAAEHTERTLGALQRARGDTIALGELEQMTRGLLGRRA